MLSLGMCVRYILTGTIGKIVDIKEFDEKTWALLDNGLYYEISHLVPISGYESTRNKPKESIKTDEKLKELLRKEEVEFKEDLCGAG